MEGPRWEALREVILALPITAWSMLTCTIAFAWSTI